VNCEVNTALQEGKLDGPHEHSLVAKARDWCVLHAIAGRFDRAGHHLYVWKSLLESCCNDVRLPKGKPTASGSNDNHAGARHDSPASTAPHSITALWEPGVGEIVETPILSALQQRWGEELDREIRLWLVGEQGVEALHGMMEYQLGYVDERFRPQRSPGGKRFRPWLCLLACQGLGGDGTAGMTAAAAIELLHNFSLIHDDIEDRDPARRHRPTVWKVWGEAQAINAGDAMFAAASAAILQCHPLPTVALDLARRFQFTVRALTDGQYLDMSFETRQDVTTGEYVRMIGLKTAALTAYSAWAGAIIGGAGADIAGALRGFGWELGLAFQIRDDVRGIWAAIEQTGKEPAKDIQNRKKTMPVLLALERCDCKNREELVRYFAGECDDARLAIDIITQSGAEELCVSAIKLHLEAALEALNRARLDASRLDELQRLALQLTAQ